MNVALKIQSASWIPGAIEYVYLYAQQVTALRDGLEIWTYKSAFGVTLLDQAAGAKMHREVVRTLGKAKVCAVRPQRQNRARFSLLRGLGKPQESCDSLGSTNTYFRLCSGRSCESDRVPRDTEIAHKYFPRLTEIEWIPEAH